MSCRQHSLAMLQTKLISKTSNTDVALIPTLFIGLLQQVAEGLVQGILLEAQVNQHLHRGLCRL